MPARNLFFTLGICLLASAAAAQPVRLDSARVAAFLDGQMAAHLDGKHIAGATVSVVHKGRLLFSKGYGYADWTSRQPVQAGKTMFRIGSISKTFIWTAVMQLVKQGKLDLKADINQYCKDFQIASAFSKPITLLDLMNHTPGFEDKVIGLFAKSPDRLRPLGDIIREEMPARIWPPGEIASYSNHGSAMAAYIVEQVSGLSWDEYVEKHIIRPLFMNHTTFRQPLPDTLAADISKGYQWAETRMVEKPFEYVPLAPVGAASATANDMARYMLAHLQLGTYDSVSILDTLTAREMQSVSFRHAPGLNPMRHGLMDYSRGGQLIFGHGGDTEWFHSLMVLFPEHQIGLFVSFNTSTGGGTSDLLLNGFVREFFPAPEIPIIKPDSTKREALERFAGAYRINRFTRTDVAKVAALTGTFNVSVTPEGYLKTDFSEEQLWIQTDSMSFREQNGEDRMVFRADEKGKITHFFLSSLPILAFERAPVQDQIPFTAGLMGSSLLFMLLALIGWPLGARWRSRYRVNARNANLLPAGARLTAWITALLFVVFALGFAFIISSASPVYGMPAGLKPLMALPWLIGLLTLASGWQMLKIWTKGKGRLFARLGYTLLFLGFVATLWCLFHWNMVLMPAI